MSSKRKNTKGKKKKNTHAKMLEHLPAEKRDLYNALKTMRTLIANKEGKPHYTVFSNEVLLLLAQNQPTNAKEMLALKGVGKVKLLKFGYFFLQVIGGHVPSALMSEYSSKSDDKAALYNLQVTIPKRDEVLLDSEATEIFQMFPPEVLCCIFVQLPVQNTLALASTCKKWCSIVSDDDVYWKNYALNKWNCVLKKDPKMSKKHTYRKYVYLRTKAESTCDKYETEGLLNTYIIKKSESEKCDDSVESSNDSFTVDYKGVLHFVVFSDSKPVGLEIKMIANGRAHCMDRSGERDDEDVEIHSGHVQIAGTKVAKNRVRMNDKFEIEHNSELAKVLECFGGEKANLVVKFDAVWEMASIQNPCDGEMKSNKAKFSLDNLFNMAVETWNWW